MPASAVHAGCAGIGGHVAGTTDGFPEIVPRRPAAGGHALGAGLSFLDAERENSELPMAGGIGLRISNNYETVMYSGHIGYHVYPPVRGRHYAELRVPATDAAGPSARN